MRRSRKPLCAFKRTGGSNPPLSAFCRYFVVSSPHTVVAVSGLDSHSDSHTRIVLSLWQPWTLLRTSVPNLPLRPTHGDHPLGGCAHHRGCGLGRLSHSAYHVGEITWQLMMPSEDKQMPPNWTLEAACPGIPAHSGSSSGLRGRIDQFSCGIPSSWASSLTARSSPGDFTRYTDHVSDGVSDPSAG